MKVSSKILFKLTQLKRKLLSLVLFCVTWSKGFAWFFKNVWHNIHLCSNVVEFTKLSYIWNKIKRNSAQWNIFLRNSDDFQCIQVYIKWNLVQINKIELKFYLNIILIMTNNIRRYLHFNISGVSNKKYLIYIKLKSSPKEL